jgi:hypothetical protein
MATMTKFLPPLALLMVVTQQAASFQLPEAAEVALVGVAFLGVAALLRAPRRSPQQNAPALILAHSTGSLRGSGSRRATRVAA